jgi:hypothetical protein
MMAGGTQRYQVVLVRSEPHVIARIDELYVQTVADTMLGGVDAVRQRALRVLVRYEEECSMVPDPVEKRLETIEFFVPSFPARRCRNTHLRPVRPAPLGAGMRAGW